MITSNTILLLGVTSLLIILVYIYGTNEETIIDNPCPLEDTADLSGYEKLPNGSYSYQDLIIPPHLWALFEYTTDEFGSRIPAKPHVRGCVCKLRPCIKFCCPLTKRRAASDQTCKDFKKNRTYTTETLVTSSDGQIWEEDLTKKFTIQYSRIYDYMFFLRPDVHSYHNYTVFENGTLLVANEDYFSKEEFCWSYLSVNEVYIPAPMIRSYYNFENDRRADTSAYTMLLSVPFFIMTIIVNLAIPELRTLNSIALSCYLISLTFAYSILAVILLALEDQFSETQCKILGFGGYYSFMAAYCWISVISFDLYIKIRSQSGKNNTNRRFIYYSIYAWGLAFILLCLTYAADHSTVISENWRPMINNYQRCWFDGVEGWTAMIYLYGPMLVFIVFSVVMFIMTAHNIYSVKRQLDSSIKDNESNKNCRAKRDYFLVYLRLFILMGITWSVEIFPYLMGANSEMVVLQYIFDIVNSVQGVVIFVLFVWKKKVKKLIRQRFLSLGNSDLQSQDSNRTQSSSYNNFPAMRDNASQKLVLWKEDKV